MTLIRDVSSAVEHIQTICNAATLTIAKHSPSPEAATSSICAASLALASALQTKHNIPHRLRYRIDCIVQDAATAFTDAASMPTVPAAHVTTALQVTAALLHASAAFIQATTPKPGVGAAVSMALAWKDMARQHLDAAETALYSFCAEDEPGMDLGVLSQHLMDLRSFLWLDAGGSRTAAPLDCMVTTMV